MNTIKEYLTLDHCKCDELFALNSIVLGVYD